MIKPAINRNVEFMKSVDISGTWISEDGRLVYLVTQVEDLFVWQVVHKNGITETGIGRFCSKEEIANPVVEAKCVEAKWNFHGGNPCSGLSFETSRGEIIMERDRAVQIKWDVRDHFKRIDDAVR